MVDGGRWMVDVGLWKLGVGRCILQVGCRDLDGNLGGLGGGVSKYKEVNQRDMIKIDQS